MTRIALIAAMLLLALAPPASGKGLGRVAICGADGCTDVTHDATEAVVQGGPVTGTPRGGHESFVLRITVTEGEKEIDTFDTRWLPGAQLLRGADGVWMEAPPKTQRELERLSDGMRPLALRSWEPVDASADAGAGAPSPVAGARPERSPEEAGDGGGPSIALAIGAPAAAALGLAALAARRRRRRS